MRTEVGELLERKARDIVAVSEGTTAFEALSEMAARGVGWALVLRGRDLAGIFTERDFSRRVVLRRLDPHATSVGEVMTENVCCVDEAAPVGHCMQIMTYYHCGHLPVTAGDLVVGVVSIGDLIAHLCGR